MDVCNVAIDLLFAVDILVSFNTSYFDQGKDKFATKRKAIAANYLRGWFAVDFIAVFPFGWVTGLVVAAADRAASSGGAVSQIGKVAKVARFYRATKLLRLIKMSKAAKAKAEMARTMQSKMKIGVAMERLMLFVITCILFIHSLACMWIGLAYANEAAYLPNWVRANGYLWQTQYELYITAVYFTVTTITTVGYGDISATETGERLLSIVTMLLGVVSFSFATGSLTSLISNADSRQAHIRQKVEVLKKLRGDYDLDDALYEQMMAHILYTAEQHDAQREAFINDLPERQKFELSKIMYQEYRRRIYFFKEVKEDQNFISWLSPLLKPLQVIDEAFIQVEQDKLTHISFLREGKASYVLPNYKNAEYLKIDEGEHFGVMDIVFRVREEQHKIAERKQRKAERRQARETGYPADGDSSTSEDEVRDIDVDVLAQRLYCKFSIQAKSRCLLLQMEKSNLIKMKIEFPEVFVKMFTKEYEYCYKTILQKRKWMRYMEEQETGQ